MKCQDQPTGTRAQPRKMRGILNPTVFPLACRGVPRVPISAVEPELSEGRGRLRLGERHTVIGADRPFGMCYPRRYPDLMLAQASNPR
jgi:hypothetical protein